VRQHEIRAVRVLLLLSPSAAAHQGEQYRKTSGRVRRFHHGVTPSSAASARGGAGGCLSLRARLRAGFSRLRPFAKLVAVREFGFVVGTKRRKKSERDGQDVIHTINFCDSIYENGPSCY
jgi:hypothetical protein